MDRDSWQFLRDLVACAGVLVPIYLAYRLQVLKHQVEIVHKATNSIVTRLVETAEAKGTLQGGVDERARADAVNTGVQPAVPLAKTLLREIGAVPDRTAEKVVEKIRDEKP